MIKVFAIIVTYNPNLVQLKLQLDEICPQVAGCVYVDNGSENRESLREFCSRLSKTTSWILNHENAGIAKAQNQGIDKAKKMGATHILLLDQDSIPCSDMVKALSAPYMQYKNIGATGPVIVNAYTKSEELFGIRISGLRILHIPLTTELNDVSYIISSGCMIPIEVIDKVGGMNDDMFIDGVDFEWCLRARNYGYKILQCTSAKLIHELGNGNSDKVLSHSPNREYYIVRNSFKMSRMKHIPCLHRVRRFAMGVLRMLSSLRPGRMEYFKYALKGAIEGFF